MKKPRSRLGYTLTELMLVVAILGIVMSVGPLMLTQLQNFYLMTTARNEIERDARASLDILNRMIRQAVKGTIVIDTNGQGPLSRIRFKHVDGRYMEFRQNGTKLEMLIQPTAGGAVNTSVLTKNLVYIAFSFPRSDDPSVISVSITMGKSIQLGRVKVLELTIQKVRVMN
jgi:prepilin-type N-terminal cleavage/methylation domain-containing protein